MAEYDTLTRSELVQLAARVGLPTSGTKAVLVGRLRQRDKRESAGQPEPVSTACGCGPGETCGTHLPVPDGWPEDLPAPDLEIPQVAPPLQPSTPPGTDAGLLRLNAARRECTVTFRVAGKAFVRNGHFLPPVAAILRDRALVRAAEGGVFARAPRIASWVPDADGLAGTAVIALLMPREAAA